MSFEEKTKESKIISFSFLIKVSSFNPATREEVRTFYDECGIDLELTTDRLDQFKAGEFEKDEISRSFSRCIMKKMKVVDENDSIIPRNLAQQLQMYNTDKTVDELAAAIGRCSQTKKGTYSNRTKKTLSCLKKSGNKIYYTNLFAQ